MAMRFPSRGFRTARNTEQETARLRGSLLGPWIDRQQVRSQFGCDIETWWYGQPGARPAKAEHHSEPTVAERAARLHQEMDQLRTEPDHLRDEHEEWRVVGIEKVVIASPTGRDCGDGARRGCGEEEIPLSG